MLERTREAYECLVARRRRQMFGIYEPGEPRMTAEDIRVDIEASEEMIRAINYNLTGRFSDLCSSSEIFTQNQY